MNHKSLEEQMLEHGNRYHPSMAEERVQKEKARKFRKNSLKVGAGLLAAGLLFFGGRFGYNSYQVYQKKRHAMIARAEKTLDEGGKKMDSILSDNQVDAHEFAEMENLESQLLMRRKEFGRWGMEDRMKGLVKRIAQASEIYELNQEFGRDEEKFENYEKYGFPTDSKVALESLVGSLEGISHKYSNKGLDPGEVDSLLSKARKAVKAVEKKILHGRYLALDNEYDRLNSRPLQASDEGSLKSIYQRVMSLSEDYSVKGIKSDEVKVLQRTVNAALNWLHRISYIDANPQVKAEEPAKAARRNPITFPNEEVMEAYDLMKDIESSSGSYGDDEVVGKVDNFNSISDRINGYNAETGQDKELQGLLRSKKAGYRKMLSVRAKSADQRLRSKVEQIRQEISAHVRDHELDMDARQQYREELKKIQDTYNTDRLLKRYLAR